MKQDMPTEFCWVKFVCGRNGFLLFNGFGRQFNKIIYESVDKKNQLDVTFCLLYFSSNS